MYERRSKNRPECAALLPPTLQLIQPTRRSCCWSILKELRLPTILREYDGMARQCAVEYLDYQPYLLRLIGLELLDRERRATDTVGMIADAPLP